MSFSPTSGIMMSSRSGDLDPGILSYLHQKTGMSIAEYTQMVNFESGLLGVSGSSADMYTLLQRAATDPHAAEAIELFVYQTKKSIGSLSATLGGLDSLIFTGGIGERSAPLRARICEGLGYLGIELDAGANDQQAALISAPGSQVGVHVIPADEAQIISKQVMETLNKVGFPQNSAVRSKNELSKQAVLQHGKTGAQAFLAKCTALRKSHTEPK
jgi:acetate kinase